MAEPKVNENKTDVMQQIVSIDRLMTNGIKGDELGVGIYEIA